MMWVKELMTRDIKMIDSNVSIVEAANEMKKSGIGFLPVLEAGRLVGAVTDRDIVIRAVAEGLDLGNTRVQKITSFELISCFEEDDLSEAVRLLTENQIQRLVVTDSKMHPVGVLSVGDLANRVEMGVML